MNYLVALKKLHAAARPRLYFEIGCRKGHSLSLARCPSVGVDPNFTIVTPLVSPTRIFKETSDGFFARPNVSRILSKGIDLAFIDGMHLAEFALRDFMNIERHASRSGIVVIDDTCPSKIEYASRQRDTALWTGDIYKIVIILREYRPDLRVEVFDINLKGFCLIWGLNPNDTVLRDSYPEIEKKILNGHYEFKSVSALRERLGVKSVAELDKVLTTFESDFSGLSPAPQTASVPRANSNENKSPQEARQKTTIGKNKPTVGPEKTTNLRKSKVRTAVQQR